MTNTQFSDPTQYRINSLTLAGEDAVGLFQSLSIYENIYSPIITGTVTILDTDGLDFIGSFDIEFNEEIEFSFTSAKDEELTFTGKMNGIRNEVVKGSKKMYAVDFTSESVRKNETKFITKKFDQKTPKDIVEEMVEKIGGEMDKSQGQGKPMSFVGNRKRPVDVIKYVMTHGVTEGNSASDNGKTQEEESKGTTGFLCWETLDGYRFASVDEVNSGNFGEKHDDFKTQLANTGLSMEEAMNGIIDYEFTQIGDQQSRLRASAFNNTVISFDMDKGTYKEFAYQPEEGKTGTSKRLEDAKFPSRFMMKMYNNEKFENGCEKAQSNQWDQSREYLAQNNVRQNTSDDQSGKFVLPPQFMVRAGDTMDVKIGKVKSEDNEGGYDKKHSGRYLIKGVGHHFNSSGTAYTKLTTNRTTVQQDDMTSEQS